MWKGKKYYCLVAMLCCCALLHAQPSPVDSLLSASPGSTLSSAKHDFTPFVVGEIYITGNKKTKPYIIERELPFKTGDSIYLPDLVKGFDIARQQLINTLLFNDVVIALKSFRGYIVDIEIEVKERWYIFPIPYIKPVDRNLSEWAKQGYGVDRLNWGFKFDYNNFTGRNDKLRMWLISGYTKQIQFQYDQPYADKSLRFGYKVGFSYAFNREVNYITTDNQQRFVDSLPNGITHWTGSLDLTYRPGLRTFHDLRFTYTRMEVDSEVIRLNPKFFNVPRTSVTYPELAYTLNYYNVDYKAFPLTGWMGNFTLLKRGLNSTMSMWQFSFNINKGWQIAKKTYFGWQGLGTVKFPFDQPFVNQPIFGYGEFYVRGLERYVIDGEAGIVSKQSLRREVMRFNIPTAFISASHDHIPFRIYARA